MKQAKEIKCDHCIIFKSVMSIKDNALKLRDEEIKKELDYWIDLVISTNIESRKQQIGMIAIFKKIKQKLGIE